ISDEGEGEREGEPAEGEPAEGEQITVPNLINLSRNTAESLIVSSGFTIGSVTEEYSETVQIDRVVMQTPEPGTLLAPGDPITIAVSLGTRHVIVPDLNGKQESEIETTLLAAGLLLGAVYEEHHPEMAAGRVIRQDPEAGSEALRHSQVDITLSLGPEPVADEGEGEEDTEDSPGCCRGLFNGSDAPSKAVKRMLGDWLLIGLALLSVKTLSLVY
ncbi:MAG TPA: PASTA domain-containing protein, partial [Candidatus Hydrogenedentes bacterium]|nr:PASTA domain-containing protein [Candidatus Hydrogenedentota bacterium]